MAASSSLPSSRAANRTSPQQYIAERKLEPLLEKAVNALYRDLVEDVAPFLADFFKKEAGGRMIDKVHAREVLDSRGNPTVEVDVMVGGKLFGRAAAPSGASKGSNEALELRDESAKDRFMGKGVLTAVTNVKERLAKVLVGTDPTDQKTCDKRMCDEDGTERKTVVGGNAITATSFAIAETGAAVLGIPLYQHFASLAGTAGGKFSLPTPMVNILNGGKHAGGKLKIQEFMIVPKRGQPFREALRQVTEVYHTLGGILAASKYGPSACNLGDEGGFAPPIATAEEALQLLEEAIVKAGYVVGETMFLALDCAASSFYDAESKTYSVAEGEDLDTTQMIDFLDELVKAHPSLISIEDGLDEKDYDGWAKLTERLGSRVQIVGDDLFTSNPSLIRRGLEGKWANALLLKVNQIGTVSEAIDAATLMRSAKCNVIVSHRSGETTYTHIADLAVGIGARYIKTGSVARGERVAKYNRLLQIEEELDGLGLLETPQP